MIGPLIRRHTSIVSLLGTLLLGLVLLWLAIRGADWRQMLKAAHAARLDDLGFACLALSVSYFLRGLRWRVILSAATRVPTLTVFWATMVGYLGNNFLPARAGELLRSVLLGRSARVDTSYVLATALTERVMDLIALIAMSLVAVLWLGTVPSWIFASTAVLGGVGFLAMVGFVGAPRLETWLTELMVRAPIPPAIRVRAIGLLNRFLLGLLALQNTRRVLNFTGLTVVIWLVDALAAIAVARSFNMSMNLPLAMLLLVALGLSSAVPSTPGSVGVYQFVTVTVLMPFDIARSEALVYIIAFQAAIYCVVTVWGMIGLWKLSKRDSPAFRVDPGGGAPSRALPGPITSIRDTEYEPQP